MHSLTKLTSLIRKEIYRKYTEKMIETRWKWKEKCYGNLWEYYRVHINTIRKIIKRWRVWDFTIHKSTTRKNLWHKFIAIVKAEKMVEKRIKRNSIIRYEKTIPWELVHIDIHKIPNIKWENPKQKQYLIWLIDDATRLIYSEVILNKKATTAANFLKRANLRFLSKWIKIKSLISDNWCEFTTHIKKARKFHKFEIMCHKINIKHKYTKVRRPQTNWKIERFWRIFKDNFFSKNIFSSNQDFDLKFTKWIFNYNYFRKHWGIQYLTPSQKFNLLSNS